MQYDLFHVYTVDEHTLSLVRNLRRFTVHEFALEYPLCSHIVATLPKPELLYLAGLFHDIAKGRNGDHSELGAVDARAFCLQHDLSDYDTGLVTWLVENHLLMSSTSQREDISDPVVVNRFAKRMKDTVHLDYLYVLTVADVRATNPELWNNWKDALLKELYYNTRRAPATWFAESAGTRRTYPAGIKAGRRETLGRRTDDPGHGGTLGQARG